MERKKIERKKIEGKFGFPETIHGILEALSVFGLQETVQGILQTLGEGARSKLIIHR